MPQSNDKKPDFSNAEMTLYDLPRPINPVLRDDLVSCWYYRDYGAGFRPVLRFVRTHALTGLTAQDDLLRTHVINDVARRGC